MMFAGIVVAQAGNVLHAEPANNQSSKQASKPTNG